MLFATNGITRTTCGIVGVSGVPETVHWTVFSRERAKRPVKHGLVARAADWPHSSIYRDIRAGRVEAERVGVECEGTFGE